ncbi:S-adenosyl-L-methionine-dependent methyltransferase [Laetiporus sulphureus 93-53]|uniref:Trimethylguanosine synthase n=1 Tax=Laetiporus sulphureus 93-53 TaxID=1314785 RepID=A0A165GDD3_9APHY|nr:S-adenosyl-L-methionine-dependent methyltransferase [Laetiporus sulphureus 93-53]KZT10193.1 S-adenosyl-L-methionine-dependent methyltransferase [Laetiporus sulphureus 93-53]
MGRKGVISGLSRFVSRGFDTSEDLSQAAAEAATLQPSLTANAAASDKDEDIRPKKRRKTGLLGPGREEVDATGLAPFYVDALEVPDHLQKYFSQRERYFSLYSSGCLLDEEGWYSVTPERVADQIAERCRCGVIVDAFCGVGGNAIAFARTCERVIAIDNSPVRLALARHNAAIYGVADRIEFIIADFLSFARTLAEIQDFHNSSQRTDEAATETSSLTSSTKSRKIDVVFLSPPWGGPSYLTDTLPTANGVKAEVAAQPASTQLAEYSLASIKPVHGKELFQLARRLTRNVAYFLPRNVNLEEVASLVREEAQAEGNGNADSTTRQDDDVEMVEVEEEWMGSKLKALTCYFGGLVSGQENLF